MNGRAGNEIAMGTRASIAAILVGALLLFAACGDSEEVLAPISTTPTAAPTAAPTDGAAPTHTSAPSVPTDWQTFVDPGGRFTLRYPPGWFKGQADDFYSNDPSSVHNGGQLPPEVIKVEVVYSTAQGSDVCGPILKTDPKTGVALGLLDGVEPASLGGIQGGRLTRTEGDPAVEDGLTRIEGIGVIKDQHCVLVAAYYSQEIPDTGTVSTIFGSFRFGIAPAE